MMKTILTILLINLTTISFGQLRSDTAIYENGREINPPPKWVYAATSKPFDTEWYIYNEDFKKDVDGLVKVWIKSTVKQITVKGKIYKGAFQKQLLKINCEGKSYTVETSLFVSAAGGTLLTKDADYIEHPIVPESAMEVISKRVCNYVNN
jgi:hypothetical protein